MIYRPLISLACVGAVSAALGAGASFASAGDEAPTRGVSLESEVRAAPSTLDDLKRRDLRGVVLVLEDKAEDKAKGKAEDKAKDKAKARAGVGAKTPAAGKTEPRRERTRERSEDRGKGRGARPRGQRNFHGVISKNGQTWEFDDPEEFERMRRGLGLPELERDDGERGRRGRRFRFEFEGREPLDLAVVEELLERLDELRSADGALREERLSRFFDELERLVKRGERGLGKGAQGWRDELEDFLDELPVLIPRGEEELRKGLDRLREGLEGRRGERFEGFRERLDRLKERRRGSLEPGEEEGGEGEGRAAPMPERVRELFERLRSRTPRDRSEGEGAEGDGDREERRAAPMPERVRELLERLRSRGPRARSAREGEGRGEREGDPEGSGERLPERVRAFVERLRSSDRGFFDGFGDRLDLDIEELQERFRGWLDSDGERGRPEGAIEPDRDGPRGFEFEFGDLRERLRSRRGAGRGERDGSEAPSPKRARLRIIERLLDRSDAPLDGSRLREGFERFTDDLGRGAPRGRLY